MTIASLVLVLGAGLVSAQEKEPGKTLPLKARDFLPQALAEVMAVERFSSLVEKRAENKDVKGLADKLLADGKKCRESLTDIAKGEKVGIFTGLEKRHQLTLGELTLLSANKFDRAYLAQMIRDLEAIDKLMEGQARGGDKPLQNLAKDHRPMWSKHLETARDLQKKVGLPEARKEK